MKIAYILPSFSGDFERPNGGVESASINLILGLLEIKSDVTVFLVYPNVNQIIRGLPKGVLTVPVNSFFRHVWTYNYPLIGISKRMEKAVEDINPDIVHVQGAPGFFRKCEFKKLFLTIHGIPYLDSQFQKRLGSRIRSLLTEMIYKYDLKRYENIVFLGNYGYSLLKKDICKRAKVYFVPNPIAMRKSFKISPENQVTVLFFSGILRPLKNIEAIVEACSKLKIRKVDFLMKFAGKFHSRDYEQKIKTLIDRFNLTSNIVFLGQLSSKEMEIELNKVDINLLPSFQEVCPMSIIEAMALGKPTIASSVGGVPDVILNSYNGYLIPIDNSEELANKICLLTDSSNYKTMRQNCLNMVGVFDCVNIAERTLQYYLD
jgi:glycosyltransferase involved in cell wall biosynthesis